MIKGFEGSLYPTVENKIMLKKLEDGEDITSDVTIEAIPCRLDPNKDMYFSFGVNVGVLAASDFAIIDSALVSSVYMNKPVGFKVVAKTVLSSGAVLYTLSRKEVLKEYMDCIKGYVHLTLLAAKITSVRKDKIFLDIGGGLPSVLRPVNICTSVLQDLNEYFAVGDVIKVILTNIKDNRIYVTQLPLNGTFDQAKQAFLAFGEYDGIVTAVTKDFTYVALAPNFTGVIDTENLSLKVGSKIKVKLTSINSITGRVRLEVVSEVGDPTFNLLSDCNCFKVTNLEEDGWRYSSDNAKKKILYPYDTWRKEVTNVEG